MRTSCWFFSLDSLGSQFWALGMSPHYKVFSLRQLAVQIWKRFIFEKEKLARGLNSKLSKNPTSLFKNVVNKFQSRFFYLNGQVELSLFFNIQKMNNACRSAFSCLKAYLFLSHWTLCLSDRTRYINSDADKKWVNWRTSLWCEKVQLMYQIKGVNF